MSYQLIKTIIYNSLKHENISTLLISLVINVINWVKYFSMFNALQQSHIVY
jgi:hypothetical protein